MKKTILMALLVGVITTANAAIEVYEFKTAEDETRYRALIEELRCPKCQNQNLAGSDAPIAVDLKQKTYQMINEGKSDGEIRQFMFDRYGDFISYKPPVRPSTWVLWFFPPLLLVLLIIGWLHHTRKSRQNIAIDHQDIDALTAGEEAELAKILKSHDHKEQKQ